MIKYRCLRPECKNAARFVVQFDSSVVSRAVCPQHLAGLLSEYLRAAEPAQFTIRKVPPQPTTRESERQSA